jgi:predicted DCC family thiol-disulfide oxidoreductase YuxK
MVAGKVLPRFLRDGLYNFISRNRYRIFGRRKSCMIPDPAHKGKFLE